MLAGAEGRTAETKDKVDPAIMQAQAARIGMWSAVAVPRPGGGRRDPAGGRRDRRLDLNKILAQPLVFLGRSTSSSRPCWGSAS
jgi:hypothetical protein